MRLDQKWACHGKKRYNIGFKRNKKYFILTEEGNARDIRLYCIELECYYVEI